MEHFEKTIATETKFNGKIIDLTVDTVLLENGASAFREVVHHPGGACIAALTPQKEIYLVKQFRYPFGTELWELPAGKLEKGEDPFCAAKRELEEEVGITANNFVDLGQFYPTVGYCNEIIYTWAATDITVTQTHFDDDEFLTIKKFPFEQALQMVKQGKIKDGKTVAGILKVNLLLADGTILL